MEYIIFLAPIRLFGEGTYGMTDVKVVEATENYLGLDEDTRKCQIEETFEKCTTREYLHNVNEKCNCVPYGLSLLSPKSQVTKNIYRVSQKRGILEQMAIS